MCSSNVVLSYHVLCPHDTTWLFLFVLNFTGPPMATLFTQTKRKAWLRPPMLSPLKNAWFNGSFLRCFAAKLQCLWSAIWFSNEPRMILFGILLEILQFWKKTVRFEINLFHPNKTHACKMTTLPRKKDAHWQGTKQENDFLMIPMNFFSHFKQ